MRIQLLQPVGYGLRFQGIEEQVFQTAFLRRRSCLGSGRSYYSRHDVYEQLLSGTPGITDPVTRGREEGTQRENRGTDRKNAETDHEQAYEWALCLSLLDASLQSQTRQQELLKQPKVKLYADGLKEMDRFVVKHFATSPMDYKNNNGTKAAQRDATALAEKYKDTGLAPVFTRMGEPSVMP